MGISWRANEIKSDMFVAEIEALYHAIQKRRGKVYRGKSLEVLTVERMEVEGKIDNIKEYVGKYTPKHLESIERHRKL